MVAVDINDELRIAELEISRHVAQFRALFEPVHQARHRCDERVEIGTLQRVLHIGIGLAPADLDILHRLVIGIDARNDGRLAPEPPCHFLGSLTPLGTGLECDEQPCRIGRGGVAAPGREHIGHRRILADDSAGLLGLVGHGGETGIGQRL